MFLSDDKSDHSIVPLKAALSRHRRSALSPVLLALRLLGIGDNRIIKDLVNLIDFTNDLFNGQLEVCPKTEKLSIVRLIQNVFWHPIGTVENILCNFVNMIGNEGLVIVRALFQIFSQFIRKIFLPKLHTILNLMLRSHLMPSNLVIMIEMFNVLYAFLKLIGYVE